MADNPDQPAGLEKYVPTTSAAVYLSRRNAYYYNSGWTKGGLQLESAAATNFLPYGVDFTNVAWSKVDTTVALSSGDIYEITESASGTGTPYLLDFVTIASGAAHCISIDVKDVDRGYAFLQWTDAASRFAINVDLSDGSVTDTDTVNSPGVVGYGAIPLGDGWYRLWVAATSASTNGYLIVGPSDSATPTWTAAAVPQYTLSGKKIQVRYAQLEAGSVPTSYIPTSGSTVPRAAETLTIAGANNPITATTATFFYDFLYTTNNTDPYAKPLEIVFTSNERMRIYDGDGANRGYVEWFNDPGLDYTDIYTGASGSFPGVNVRRRGCASIAENDELLISVNGSATGPTAVTAIADFSGQDIDVGTKLTTRQFTCFVREIRVGSFKTSGADAEAVTTL
jgi:hypothetical protein